MRLFLPFVCALCATPLHGIFEGTCPKQDPGPGVLVLRPGSKLLLTCRGQVKVDGLDVNVITNKLNADRRENDANQSHVNIVNNGFLARKDKRSVEEAVSEGYRTVTGEKPATRSQDQARGRTGRYDADYEVSPTAQTFQLTSRGSALKGESDWEAEEMADEGDYEEEEEKEGCNRVTRSMRMRPQWMRNGTVLKRGDKGGLLLEKSGFRLSVPSVTPTHSGRYTCHHRGKIFSLKLIVADPPENPTLFCYKRSPSSKIRCEWIPKNPITVRTQCYLFLKISPSQTFLRSPCSYSAQKSRCWCALEHNEDDRRKYHMAYLCATSNAGNATSNLLHFTPLAILKPDPPSNVAVQQMEGQNTWIRVTWNSPISWKYQDNYYELIYEISYQPYKPSFSHEQTFIIKGWHSYTITDALPGVEYAIKLRTKEEYDGQWSNWSTPVYACSWTDQRSVAVLSDDVITTAYPLYSDKEGSGTDDYVFEVTESQNSAAEVSYHIMWIAAAFILLMVIFAVYMFRYKERVMSKLQNLAVVTQHSNSSPAPITVPPAPEEHTLMTFAPPCYKNHPLNDAEEGEEENEEEHRAEDSGEAMHFSNTSYYLIQRD